MGMCAASANNRAVAGAMSARARVRPQDKDDKKCATSIFIALCALVFWGLSDESVRAVAAAAAVARFEDGAQM